MILKCKIGALDNVSEMVPSPGYYRPCEIRCNKSTNNRCLSVVQAVSERSNVAPADPVKPGGCVIRRPSVTQSVRKCHVGRYCLVSLWCRKCDCREKNC